MTETRGRWDRTAGAIQAVVGVLLLGLVLEMLADVGPDLGSADPHLAGDAQLALILGGIPIAAAGLLTLVCARRLWGTRPGSGPLAILWVAVAAVCSGILLGGFGNSLWALRILVMEPGRLSVRWPRIYYDPFEGTDVTGTPPDLFPSASLDSLFFWMPVIGAIAALAVAACLLAGWVAGRSAGRRSG